MLVDGGSLHRFGGSLVVGVDRGGLCASRGPLLIEIGEVEFVGNFLTMVAHWIAISFWI